MIAHYPGCHSHYPEKPAGEPAKHIEVIDLENDEGEEARVCTDCGASEVVKKGILNFLLTP